MHGRDRRRRRFGPNSRRTQRPGVGRRASSVPLGLPPGHPGYWRAHGIPGEEFHGLGGFLVAPAGRGHSISKMPRTGPYNPNFEHHVLKINGVHTPIFLIGLVNTITKDLKTSSTRSLADAFHFFGAPQGGL